MKNFSAVGFTLIEVLIAMVIMSIGLLALSSLQGNSAKGNMKARVITHAVHLGDSQIEKLMKSSYADCISGSRTEIINNREYSVEWNCTENPGQSTKYVELNVNWGNNNNFTFHSIKIP